MAKREHLKILKQGVDAWNKWRKENLEIKPDLTEAKLYEADLSEADLSVAVLSVADLNVAKLIEADLTRANLYGADLNVADLSGASLNGAQDLTAKQLITTINWQEAILDSSLRVEAEKLIGAEK